MVEHGRRTHGPALVRRQRQLDSASQHLGRAQPWLHELGAAAVVLALRALAQPSAHGVEQGLGCVRAQREEPAHGGRHEESAFSRELEPDVQRRPQARASPGLELVLEVDIQRLAFVGGEHLRPVVGLPSIAQGLRRGTVSQSERTLGQAREQPSILEGEGERSREEERDGVHESMRARVEVETRARYSCAYPRAVTSTSSAD